MCSAPAALPTSPDTLMLAHAGNRDHGLVVILVVALLVFGPKRLPEIGRSLGRGMREFKDSISGKDDKPTSCRPPPTTPRRPRTRAMRPVPRRLRHGEEATLVEHLGELAHAPVHLPGRDRGRVRGHVHVPRADPQLAQPAAAGRPQEARRPSARSSRSRRRSGSASGRRCSSRCRSSSGRSGRSWPGLLGALPALDGDARRLLRRPRRSAASPSATGWCCRPRSTS